MTYTSRTARKRDTRKRNRQALAKNRGTSGFIAHAEEPRPHHDNFPNCPKCGFNTTWPHGLCRLCAEAARVESEMTGTGEWSALEKKREQSKAALAKGRRFKKARVA